jgi:site-specific DNA-methyltransferase (adenine-specific)
MKSRYEIFNEDCLVKMKSIPDKSVDMILCDLPYGTTACKWDVIIPFYKLWEQYKRVIKDNGAIVLFGSEPFSSQLRTSNLKMFKYDWIWKKSTGGGFLLANKMPLKRHEICSVFYKKLPDYFPIKTKGKPYTCKRASGGEIHGKEQAKKLAGWTTKSNGERFPTSILEFKNDTGFHPTQKPISLLEYLIKSYTQENELVLDNTMGSGSTGVACINTNRKFVGIEKDKKYFEIAKKRLNKALENQENKDLKKAA